MFANFSSPHLLFSDFYKAKMKGLFSLDHVWNNHYNKKAWLLHKNPLGKSSDCLRNSIKSLARCVSVVIKNTLMELQSTRQKLICACIVALWRGGDALLLLGRQAILKRTHTTIILMEISLFFWCLKDHKRQLVNVPVATFGHILTPLWTRYLFNLLSRVGYLIETLWFDMGTIASKTVLSLLL